MNLACAACRCSTAEMAFRFAVMSAPTTKTTPVALFDRIAASVTAITGGASMMIQSNCCRSSSSVSRYLVEPSSSAGFGGM